MNKKELTILVSLIQLDIASPVTAISVKDINQLEGLTDVKPNTLFKTLQFLAGQGYVDKGMKDGRACTFFITTKGKEKVRDYA